MPSLPPSVQVQVSLTGVVPEGAEHWLSADHTTDSWGNNFISEEESEWPITGSIPGGERRQTENKSLSLHGA